MEMNERSLLRIAEALESLSAEKVGDLTELDTTDKTNLVAAVNEVVGNVEDLGDDVEEIAAAQGDLSDLTTTAKTSIVAAINELVERVAALEPTE